MDKLNQPPTTVMGWLEWAKAAGYEWAQSAIDQHDPKWEPGEPAYKLSHAVDLFNEWEKTKEGREYWHSIFLELLEKGL